MRPSGAGAAGVRSLVIVMAIGAVNEGRRRHRRDQTGCDRIFSHHFDRMERHVVGTEFEAGIGLDELPLDAGGSAIAAVAVAAETQFVFILDLRQFATVGGDTADSGQRPRGSGRDGNRRSDGVRVVAIFAGDMARAVDDILGGIMLAGGHHDRMRAEFVQFGRDVFASHGAAVAGKTILLVGREVK